MKKWLICSWGWLLNQFKYVLQTQISHHLHRTLILLTTAKKLWWIENIVTRKNTRRNPLYGFNIRAHPKAFRKKTNTLWGKTLCHLAPYNMTLIEMLKQWNRNYRTIMMMMHHQLLLSKNIIDIEIFLRAFTW